MANNKKVPKLRRIVGGLLAVLIMGTAVGVGSALSAKGSRQLRSPHPTGTQHRRENPGRAFAVLAHKRGHAAAAAADGMIPAGAVLAATVGHIDVYLWERAKGEVMLGPGTPPAREQAICEGFLITGEGRGAGRGGSCAPAGKLAETGGALFSQVRNPTTKQLSPMTATVVVPNSVKNVRFNDADGSSYEVAVRNNVVVVEDEHLVPPPSDAVSYVLPDGEAHGVPMAAPEGSAP